MRTLTLAAALLLATGCASEPARPGIIMAPRTVAYVTPDLEAAKAWYSTVLAVEPYFDEPYYAGYRIGDIELGLDPDTTAARPGHGGTRVYWEVADADTAYSRLLSLGARSVEDVSDVGGGVRVAMVEDPFGNLLGIIETP